MISGFPTDTLQLISPCWDQFARRIPQFGDPLGGDRMLGCGSPKKRSDPILKKQPTGGVIQNLGVGWGVQGGP